MDESNPPEVDICFSCKSVRIIVFIDDVDRPYCKSCWAPNPVRESMLEFLLTTIPFDVGDDVECRTAGILFDGVGTIDEVSIDPSKFGTPVYPSFHVKLSEKSNTDVPDEVWYTEVCLKKVTSSA